MKQSKTVLHHYLGTGLKMMYEKSGRIITLEGLHYEKDDKLIIRAREGYYDSEIWNFKPALHSMNRLTMPLENGEIPLIELAKINDPDLDWFLSKENKCVSGGWFFYYDPQKKEFKLKFQNHFAWTSNTMQIFQYLINNHFNIFNLPESEYIEKSTLKL